MLNVTTRLIATLLLSLLAGPAVAQSRDAKAMDKKHETRGAAPKDRTSGMKPCPEYGAGFYRLSGSDTCVRVSGGVGIDVGTSGVRR